MFSLPSSSHGQGRLTACSARTQASIRSRLCVRGAAFRISCSSLEHRALGSREPPRGFEAMCAYRAGALELQAIRGSSCMHLAGASRAVPRPQVVSKPAGPHRLRRLAPLGPRLERQGHAEREPSREALYPRQCRWLSPNSFEHVLTVQRHMYRVQSD